LRLEYHGEFATVFKNILGCESVARRRYLIEKNKDIKLALSYNFADLSKFQLLAPIFHAAGSGSAFRSRIQGPIEGGSMRIRIHIPVTISYYRNPTFILLKGLCHKIFHLFFHQRDFFSSKFLT
jgi:hypothetical protein